MTADAADQQDAPLLTVRQARALAEDQRKQTLETGRNRLLVTAAIFSLALVAIGFRLTQVMVLGEEGEPRLARSATSRAAPVGRADILDRNGIVLATSLPTASLYANPDEILDAEEAAAKLLTVLPDLDPKSLMARLTSRGRFIWLRRSLTPNQQYDVNSLGIPGIGFQTGERRVYPHGSALAHVLGLTDVDGQGIAGVEKSFNRMLSSGDKPLRLSLDLRVQDIVRRELSEAAEKFRAVGGAGLVMDVRTGEILAMASLPDFDPNQPSEARGDSIFNRVTKGVYEMGSTFKLFNTAMALDTGTVTMTDGYDASEPIKVARFTITDYHPMNRWLSVSEILVHSSNIGSAKMAMDVGAAAQRSYLGKLGLLSASAIELPEIGRPQFPGQWRDISTMTISYGHGIAVTPLQLAGAVSGVVNGGILYPPTLIKPDLDRRSEGRRVLSPETSRQMRDLMGLVVSQGTGGKAQAPGYDVGGKTGTAEKMQGGRYLQNASISSFVGAFPIGDPRYVVLVMLDEPKGTKETHNYATGGWVAAPVVGAVVRRMAPLLGMPPEMGTESPGDASSLLVAAKSGGRGRDAR